MKEDKYRFLKQYARPCFSKKRKSLEELPHIKQINDFLKGDYSLEKVRDYFFISHNLRTIKESRKDNYAFHHLVIPYDVLDIQEKKIITELHEPFFSELLVPLCHFTFDMEKIDNAKSLGIIGKLSEGNLIITHAMEIVDSCKQQDLNKYNYLYADRVTSR